EPQTKDRRYERGIIVNNENGAKSFADLIADSLLNKGITAISESKLLSFLVANNMAYKTIPKDLYVSDRFKYSDNMFTVVVNN
ncbi:MAG: hypothetical protein IJM79_02970, partial [Erysipelotrichaceae bacterium]|nr:hypothetical protein [Erysipelotrichaceae bacterium]